MSDFYTVIIISTINSLYGSYSPTERFSHTLECIESIKRNIPNAKILFVDNSNEPVKEEWRTEIQKSVEIFYQIPHNLFSLQANMNKITKSQSEANMLFMALDILRKTNMIGKRIFKISGRYKLLDTFDIHEYENPEMEGKFTFVTTAMLFSKDNWFSKKKVMWHEQAFISFTKENIDEFQHQLFGMLEHMNRTGDCIEETMVPYIPEGNIFSIKRAHVTGSKAEDREVVNH